MFGLCKFRDALGIPGKGVHAPRVLGLALVDIMGTVVISYLISQKFAYPVWKVFPLLMVGVIGIHRVFCVNTALNVFLFGGTAQ